MHRTIEDDAETLNEQGNAKVIELCRGHSTIAKARLEPP